MPMYSQHCTECKKTKMKISSIAARDNQSCDECGTPTQRLIDVPGLVYGPTSSKTGGTLR